MSSSPAALLLLFVFALDLKTERCSAARIGLFGSSGCYSHDVTMRAAGEVFRGHDVAWVQTFTFDFGVPAPTLPSNWHRMIVNQVSEDSTAALHYTKSIIWETVVPMDVRRLWDLRPQWAIFNILRTQHMACYATLRSANFTTFLQQHGNLDLAVVDYMLQECMVGTSALFNATVSVYFSNWPLSDGYVASFNIPWMPSTVAKTSSGLPTHMNFAERTANMVVQIFFLLSHSLQIAVVDVLHSWVGYESDILATESRQLLYATHSEFVIEMTRPISNQIKFFGCQRCLPSDPAKATRRSAEIQTDQLLTLPSSSSSSITTTPSSFTDVGGIDRHLLLRPFIVVTFGSISSVQTMGAHLLHDFMRAFGALNHTVFWQFDGVPPADQRIPENVHLISWLPLKELFGMMNFFAAFIVVSWG
uniref:glucuronosyltransferase n=1 Tax=Plectus sambesii TaxID=2011161 RepID=A0A914URC0_9BILA